MRLKAFLVGAAFFLASCSKQKQVEPVIQVVRAGVVEEIQPTAEERYSVSIEPFEKVDLAFKSGGIVERILQVRGADGRMRNVQAGDKVPRNAELAQVRSLDTVTGAAGLRCSVGNAFTLRLDASVINSRPVLSRRGAGIGLERQF